MPQENKAPVNVRCPEVDWLDRKAGLDSHAIANALRLDRWSAAGTSIVG